MFLPILVATFCSTMAGLLVTALVQRRNLGDRVVLAYLGAMSAVIAGLVVHLARLDRQSMELQSAVLANALILSIVTVFLSAALLRGVAVYEVFVEGAKDGFTVAVGIIPYLVAMLVAIGVLRSSGALDLVLGGVRSFVDLAGLDSRWVDGLPTALVRPLSGSGARAMVIETMKVHGADSFAGRLACVIQGSTETTFYVLAVYFGAVGIRRSRHALGCGLAADLAGFTAAILVSYLVFG